MKKQLVLAAVLVLTGAFASYAQPGGGMRRTVAERVQMVHQKMDSAFKFDAAKLAQIDTVFAVYYRSTDQAREEIMAGGGDRAAIREKMQELINARDKELSVLLGEANFTKWKNDIEPGMMPRRGPGGGGPGGPGGNRQ
jgi:RPA family protein